MATYFMNIEGQVPKGAATLEKFTGGDGLPKDGWFAIETFDWGGSRTIGMDVGDHCNMDSGTCMMHEVRIQKNVCGAYENVVSQMIAPSNEGKKFFIIATKPERAANQGPEVYLQFTLSDCRISFFSMKGTSGTPGVSFSVVYGEVQVKHWYESSTGELTPGGLIAYNVKTASAESTVS